MYLVALQQGTPRLLYRFLSDTRVEGNAKVMNSDKPIRVQGRSQFDPRRAKDLARVPHPGY